jgi:uncharacterized protein YdeI (YjbR/CyaY-like superfamily)
MTDIEPLILADAAAWRQWLDANEDTSDGVWLVLAKKGTVSPTSLSYAEALDEALCSGWIDGPRRGRDASTFLQRYTPRRRASMWSQRNVGIVATLIDEGRMRPRGQAEIDRAKADGRWDRAYAGPATAEVPTELREALAADPALASTFDAANGTNRYAILHRLLTAPNPGTRAKRLERIVEMLRRGEYPYPQ